MKPTDRTDPSQTESLAFELELPHPPEKVWRALTEPELLSEWLLPVTGLKLAVDAPFVLQSQPQPGWDGSVDCRVLEVEPHRKFSYRWVVGELDTVVTFTLASVESGTRLSIVQSGFREEQKPNFTGARYGWKMMGERLVELLADLP